MRDTSEGGGITRRNALAVFTAAGLGLAVSGLPMLATESTTDVLAQRLPKFSEKSRALLRELLNDSGYSGRIPADAAATLAKNEKSIRGPIDGRTLAFRAKLLAGADFQFLRRRRRARG